MKLTIELVPESCWYSNVRSEVSKAEWDKIRRATYVKYHYRCAVCGGKGDNHPVECHEVWEYKDGVQRLMGFVALCPACHEVKHIGLAKVRGRYEEALKHFAKVNGVNVAEAEESVTVAVSLWMDRSKQDWELDITYLAGR